MLHGFTSTTASMQPVADAVTAAGFDVELPLLPGHGTRWEDLAATRAEEILQAVAAAHRRLAARCGTVIPVGLSMGGALALWSAAEHGSPAAAVINPGLRLAPGTVLTARLLGRFTPTWKPLAGDIAAPGVTEQAYPVTPLRAVVELDRLFAAARSRMPQLAAAGTEVLLMRSAVDKVVGSRSAALLKRALPGQVTEVVLRRSRHVATLDYDAPLVAEQTVELLRRHSHRL